MNKDFTEEFNKMWNLIMTSKSMAYGRYADGEVALMQGIKIDYTSQAFTMDKWSYTDNKISVLGSDLLLTLNHTEPDYYYAISCKCCDPHGQQWLLNHIKQCENNITYSNLWINNNYKFFVQKTGEIKEEVYLICNKNGINGMYPFDICGFYPVENDCVQHWAINKPVIINNMEKIAKSRNNTLFFISAGPLSELLIHYLWEFNKNNRYIDVGSAIDEFVHLKQTRPFMAPQSIYFSKKCNF